MFFFAKENYKRDDILQERPVLLRSQLIEATLPTIKQNTIEHITPKPTKSPQKQTKPKQKHTQPKTLRHQIE